MSLIDFESDFAEILIKHSGLRYTAGTVGSRGRIKAGGNSPFTFKGTYPQPANQDDMSMAS